MKEYLATQNLPDLQPEEVEAINVAGSQIHHRFYVSNSLEFCAHAAAYCVHTGAGIYGLRIWCETKDVRVSTTIAYTMREEYMVQTLHYALEKGHDSPWTYSGSGSGCSFRIILISSRKRSTSTRSPATFCDRDPERVNGKVGLRNGSSSTIIHGPTVLATSDAGPLTGYKPASRALTAECVGASASGRLTAVGSVPSLEGW